jgi:hypothetical protein
MFALEHPFRGAEVKFQFFAQSDGSVGNQEQNKAEPDIPNTQIRQNKDKVENTSGSETN